MIIGVCVYIYVSIANSVSLESVQVNAVARLLAGGGGDTFAVVAVVAALLLNDGVLRRCA